MPMVGFDLAGHRLGMGGGYYDRALAVRRIRQRWTRPWLLGLGFATQCVDAIPAERHDVPLDAVLTEHGLIELPVNKGNRTERCSTG